MKIQIMGSGCSKCKVLEEHARQAVSQLQTSGFLGSDTSVEKVTDMETIVGMGVMSTPALAIDGVVKSSGRVLTTDQVVALLKK